MKLLLLHYCPARHASLARDEWRLDLGCDVHELLESRPFEAQKQGRGVHHSIAGHGLAPQQRAAAKPLAAVLRFRPARDQQRPRCAVGSGQQHLPRNQDAQRASHLAALEHGLAADLHGAVLEERSQHPELQVGDLHGAQAARHNERASE